MLQRELPFANSLRHAVETVFQSNKDDGYPATYFVHLLALDDRELKTTVEAWLSSKKQSDTITSILFEHKDKKLLTLEDLIAHFGLGLSELAREKAQERVDQFRTFRGFQWVRAD